MSADRFIYFDTDGGKIPPTKAQIESLLRNYFGGAATEIEWVSDRYYVTLHGHCSFPFSEIAPELPDQFAGEQVERWIEVWIDQKDGSIDVMTRQSDHYTGAVATALAKTISRFWGGRLER